LIGVYNIHAALTRAVQSGTLGRVQLATYRTNAMMTPMQGLLNREAVTVEAIDVRPALIADRAAIYRLTENSHRVYFNLDWWTFDNWLYEERPSDAIWLAYFQNEFVGVLVASFDESPVVWLRSIAIANGYSADPIFMALLKHARSAWLAQRVERVAVLAHPEWVSDLTQRLNFERYNEIVTLRKGDRALPQLNHAPEASIRPAVVADVPAIADNDRAAFDTVWWHSETSLLHILKTVSHFVVAAIDNQVVGHAFSDLYGGPGHLIRLVVHPAYQRLGIGEQLLVESLRYQIELGAYPLTLNTQVDNAAAQALYRRYGFQSAGRSVRVMQRWFK
jgi:[ribosomal protein S18]-alanine N-acetyltransferase